MEQSEEKPNLNKKEAEKKVRQRKVAKLTNAKSNRWVWPLKVFLLSISLSIVFTIASEYLMSVSGIVTSILTAMLLVAISITFDIIGVAVTVAASQPFNSMSARKIKGAKEALILVKNAEKVAVICNDIIGDICGIVSGAAGAAIVGRLTVGVTDVNVSIMLMALTAALIAGITISGKALGKVVAISKSEKIVLQLGRFLAPFWKKGNSEGK